MSTLMERVGNERRRLRTVRQNMMAAIEQGSGGDESYVPFYIAAANYIDATMARLHGQDVRMGDMIREKVETIDAGVEQGLRELDERLKGAEEHLKPFLAARDVLQTRGAEALEKFEQEGKNYSDFIVANMGHHGPTSDLSAKLFSTADWEYMAEITDDEIARDAELFDRFVATRPAGLEIGED
jgi:hypothetical protein